MDEAWSDTSDEDTLVVGVNVEPEVKLKNKAKTRRERIYKFMKQNYHIQGNKNYLHHR